MPQFKQKILSPGRYRVGDDDFLDLSVEDLADYVDGTRDILAGGLGVQVIKQHSAIGSQEGGPQQFDGKRPNKPESSDGIGWLSDIAQGSDGSVTATFDVPLKKDAERIKKKVDRFTSPELRESHTDGKGRKYGRHFAHLALTPRPRNPEQGEIETVGAGTETQFAYQFSLEDRVEDAMPKKKTVKKKKPKQFASDKPEDRENKNNNPGEEGDMEGDGMADKIAQVKDMLAGIGVEIPADASDPESFLDQLIGALSAMQEQPPEEPEVEATEEAEEVSPAIAQFSETVKKLKGQLAQANREKLSREIYDAKLPPALTDPLLKRAKAVQFSDEGRQAAVLTISEVVKLFTSAIPENVQFADDGEVQLVDHPDASEFFQGDVDSGHLTAEAGAKEADSVIAELGIPTK